MWIKGAENSLVLVTLWQRSCLFFSPRWWAASSRGGGRHSGRLSLVICRDAVEINSYLFRPRSRDKSPSLTSSEQNLYCVIVNWAKRWVTHSRKIMESDDAPAFLFSRCHWKPPAFILLMPFGRPKSEYESEALAESEVLEGSYLNWTRWRELDPLALAWWSVLKNITHVRNRICSGNVKWYFKLLVTLNSR
jgi:hypothetical protein